MTLSSPPPATRSLRWYVQRAAIVSQFIAALLVTAVSTRFALASFDRAWGVSDANFSTKPVPHAAVSVPSQSSPRPGVRLTTPPAAPMPLPNAGRPHRMTLGVTAGSPRSEVYVNGRLVGHTPFLGDTSCKVGLPLRIEIVPDTGPPLVYERECVGGTIEISGPPP